ncbi:hypothetical protein GA0115256_143337 [Streptomyces sp. DconLS]|nr:hypothetical protein GA0115256_143337 [Streptomyces sp. DconLS]
MGSGPRARTGRGHVRCRPGFLDRDLREHGPRGRSGRAERAGRAGSRRRGEVLDGGPHEERGTRRRALGPGRPAARPRSAAGRGPQLTAVRHTRAPALRGPPDGRHLLLRRQAARRRHLLHGQRRAHGRQGHRADRRTLRHRAEQGHAPGLRPAVQQRQERRAAAVRRLPGPPGLHGPPLHGEHQVGRLRPRSVLRPGRRQQPRQGGGRHRRAHLHPHQRLQPQGHRHRLSRLRERQPRSSADPLPRHHLPTTRVPATAHDLQGLLRRCLRRPLDRGLRQRHGQGQGHRQHRRIQRRRQRRRRRLGVVRAGLRQGRPEPLPTRFRPPAVGQEPPVLGDDGPLAARIGEHLEEGRADDLRRLPGDRSQRPDRGLDRRRGHAVPRRRTRRLRHRAAADGTQQHLERTPGPSLRATSPGPISSTSWCAGRTARSPCTATSAPRG